MDCGVSPPYFISDGLQRTQTFSHLFQNPFLYTDRGHRKLSAHKSPGKINRYFFVFIKHGYQNTLNDIFENQNGIDKFIVRVYMLWGLAQLGITFPWKKAVQMAGLFLSLTCNQFLFKRLHRNKQNKVNPCHPGTN